MKRFLFSLILIVSISIPAFAFAGEITAQSQCKNLSSISTSAQYTICCTSTFKAAICSSLTTSQQCTLGVLPADQCQNQCDSIKSKNDYDVCCNLSDHPICKSLSVPEQCAYGAPINPSLCVSTQQQVTQNQPQTYTPGATYTSGQCDAFSSIDSLDKYNSCCVDLKTNTPHSPQPTSCLTMTKNQQCALGVLPADQCQNQCSSITSRDDYTTCCAGAVVANSCVALSQADICLFKTFNSTIEATNAGCPDANIAGFVSPGSGVGGSLLGGDPLGTYSNNVVVETTCSKVNLSTVDLKSFWSFFLWVRCFIGSLFPLLMTIAFLVFMWNIVNYIIKPNALKNNERRTYIIAGLIGLFVIVGMWGLVAFTTSTLGIGSVIPQLPL